MGQMTVPIVVALVASAAVFILTKPKGTHTRGPRLGDLKVTDSAYGKPIPILRGRGRAGGNIIQASDLVEIPHTEKIGGGKGGAPASKQTSYLAQVSFAMMIGEGEIDKLLRIWMDGKIVYDVTGTTNLVIKPGLVFRFYKGTETQLPDPLIESLVGESLAPAYRGVSYIVFDNLPLADFGNRPPQVTVEYAEVSTSLQPFKVISGNPYAGGVDIDKKTIAIDSNTRRGYILSYNLSTSKQYLVEFDLDSMVVTRSKLMEDIIDLDIMMLESDDAVGLFLIGLGKYDGHLYIELNQTDTDTSLGNPKQIAVVNTTTLEQVRAYRTYTGEIEEIDNANPTWQVVDGDINNIIIGNYNNLTQLHAFNSYGEQIEFNIFVGMHAFAVPSIGAFAIYGTPDLVNTELATIFPNIFDYVITDTSNQNRALAFCVEGSSSAADRVDAWVIVGGNTATTTTPESNPVHIEPIRYGNLRCFTNGNIINLSLLQIEVTDVDPIAVAWGRLRNLIYVPSDDSCIVFVDIYTAFAAGVVDQSTRRYYAVKIQNDSLEIIWSKQVPPINLQGSNQNTTAPNGITSNYTYITTTVTTLADLDVITGEYTTFSFTAAGSADLDPAMQFYDKGQDAILALTTEFIANSAPRWAKYYLNRFAGTGVSVASIVEQLSLRAGLTSDEFDVTGITGPDYEVGGFQATQPSSVRANIEPLEVAFSFYSVESDYKMKFIPKGSIDAVEIEERFLVQDKNIDILDERRIQEFDLPAYVGITFMDQDRDYNTGTVPVRRPSNPSSTMLSDNRLEVELPLVWDYSSVKKVAQRSLYSAWQERVNFKGRMSWDFLYLDPGDEIIINLDTGDVLPQRIEKLAIGGDLTMEFENVSSDVATYVSTIEGAGGIEPIRKVFSQSVVSRVFVLDMPLLSDVHNPTVGLSMEYYGLAGYGLDDWRGAILFKSPDNSTWTEIGDSVSETAYGTISTALPDNLDPFDTDYETIIEVYMVTGAERIQSVTYDQLLDGQNSAAVVKPNGEIEVIQFQTAVSLGDDRFSLSTITRGRRGTNVFCGGHVSSELFILLTEDAAIFRGIALSEIGSPFYYRAVTIGTTLASAPTVTSTTQGNDLKPYMPTHFTATIVGSDIEFEWVRNTRLGGALMDGGTGEVPLSEETEEYELELFDAPGGDLVRTFTGITTTTKLYLGADITTDFGSIPDNITFKIYQISALVGRGLSRELTVEVI